MTSNAGPRSAAGRPCSATSPTATTSIPRSRPARSTRSSTVRRTDAQLGGFLVGLRTKGATPAEVDAMVDAMLAHAAPLAPARSRRHRRHRRHGRVAAPPGRGLQHLDHRLLRGRRRRGAGVQARQPQGVVLVAARPTCSRRWASRSSSTADAVTRCVDEAGIGFAFARDVPPRHAPRRAGPGRARHPDGLQRARPAVAPRSASAARSSAWPTRRWRRWSSTCCAAAGRRGRWSCTARTASTSSRSPDRRSSGSCATGAVTESEVHPAHLGLATAVVEDLGVGAPDANAVAVREILGGCRRPARRGAAERGGRPRGRGRSTQRLAGRQSSWPAQLDRQRRGPPRSSTSSSRSRTA